MTTVDQQHPLVLRRSSSALARSLSSPGMSTLSPLFPTSTSSTGSLFVASHPASAFLLDGDAAAAAGGSCRILAVAAATIPSGGLDMGPMMVSGSPAPVVAKKERRAPVVVSPPSPMPSSTSRPGDASEKATGATGKRQPLKAASMTAAAESVASVICEHEDAAAGSGAHAVALLSARGPRAHRSKAAASDDDTPKAAPLRRSRSLTTASATAAPLSRSQSQVATTSRSREAPKPCTAAVEQQPSPSVTSPVKRPQAPAAAPAARRATVASSLPVEQLSRTVSAANISTTQPVPASKAAPPIKKFVVQANAYHCTFVQSMMMARGPEWKPAFRSAERLTAAEIAQCDFVWFKYEFIKSLPHIERVRLPGNIVEKLKQRTTEMRDMWNEGRQWKDHSGDPIRKALDMFNAYVMPEEAEIPVPSSPLTNIARKRMPNMIMCQGSHHHHVGPLPADTPSDVAQAYHALKSQLHYHFMKYTKGTPIVGCFREASAVWRKHLLYRHMKQYCDNNPEERGSVRERCPASFEYDLNSPTAAEDAKEFMRSLMADHGVVRWLAKATGGANGNGFYVTKDPDDMVRYVSGQPKKAGGETDYWIIQEFVEKMPLLFGGHRFHMKVHVAMVASPVGIDIYAYKKQRIQCCSELFDPDVMHPLSYIGNWGQQRFATNLVQEKFSTLLEDIKGEYPKLIPAWHRAKQVIAEAIEAAWLCGRQYFTFEPGCYELMGWDFVMEECPDGEWRPLVVEANHRPGFGSERKYMEKLIQEVLELVMYPIAGLSRYQKETHNGVVEAIWDHVKTIVIHPTSPPAPAAEPQVAA